jgi:hypothetical protein
MFFSTSEHFPTMLHYSTVLLLSRVKGLAAQGIRPFETDTASACNRSLACLPRPVATFSGREKSPASLPERNRFSRAFRRINAGAGYV